MSLARRREILALPVHRDLHAELLLGLGLDGALEVEAPPRDDVWLADGVRVVAWNAQRCRDPDAAAALLRATGGGILLLSELDLGMARSRQRHTARELATRLGCGYAFGVEFLELGLGDVQERSAHAGEENSTGYHGGAILSPSALANPSLVRIERSGRWFDGALGERRVGGRVAVLCRLPIGGTTVAFAAVHLESHSDPEERATQLETVFAAVDAFAPGAPALVGGDVNTHSLGRAELADRELLSRALAADPTRLADPIRHEPLFALAERRGYDWRGCNALGTSTERRSREGGSARGTLALDWFFARGLELSDPAVIAAIDPATGAALSDHEAIAVTIRCSSRAVPGPLVLATLGPEGARMPAPAVDLLDPRTFEVGVPHAFYAWLREHDPVRWNEGRPGRELFPGRVEPDQRGFWVVSRYEDVVHVSKNHALFSSERGSAVITDMPELELGMIRQQLIHMDPPRHSKLRKLVNRGFTPRMIGAMEPHVRELAREILDKVARLGECDFVTAIAAELPLLVIAELLGVPRADRWKLFSWSNRLIGAEDPDYGSPADAQLAALELVQYGAWLGDQRRADPRDDIVSTLVHADVDGEKLGGLDFNMFFFLLVIAGNETTRNAISGGMQALCEHPNERAKLVARPELLDTAVDEIVRWVTPVIQFRRTATRDLELAGQKIRENDKVVVYYGSANRDPRAFAEPEIFDVARDPNPHVGFGIGVHYCLGASLAKLEMRILFEELLRRIPDLELVGPVARLRSNFINGIKSMPVRYTPES